MPGVQRSRIRMDDEAVSAAVVVLDHQRVRRAIPLMAERLVREWGDLDDAINDARLMCFCVSLPENLHFWQRVAAHLEAQRGVA